MLVSYCSVFFSIHLGCVHQQSLLELWCVYSFSAVCLAQWDNYIWIWAASNNRNNRKSLLWEKCCVVYEKWCHKYRAKVQSVSVALVSISLTNYNFLVGYFAPKKRNKSPLYSVTNCVDFCPQLIVFIYTSHYSAFQIFREQQETWWGSTAKAGEWGGGRKQRRACAACSDSITAPVKGLFCLLDSLKLSQRQRQMKQNRQHKETRQGLVVMTCRPY